MTPSTFHCPDCDRRMEIVLLDGEDCWPATCPYCAGDELEGEADS